LLTETEVDEQFSFLLQPTPNNQPHSTRVQRVQHYQATFNQLGQQVACLVSIYDMILCGSSEHFIDMIHTQESTATADVMKLTGVTWTQFILTCHDHLQQVVLQPFIQRPKNQGFTDHNVRCQGHRKCWWILLNIVQWQLWERRQRANWTSSSSVC